MDFKEALFRQFNDEKKTIDHRVKVLQKMIGNHEDLYLPAEKKSDDNHHEAYYVLMEQVTLKSGLNCLPVFTDESAIRKERDLFAHPIAIKDLLVVFIGAKEYEGIVINIFDENSIVITKALAQRILEPFMKEDLDDEMARAQISRAIHFATEMHVGQVRKGTEKPYIIHPLEVMNILDSMNADPNLMIAGLLHDVIEDCDVGFSLICERFGFDVAALVMAHSENKDWTWEDRKSFCIAETTHGSKRLKMLVMADTVSNQSAMLRDYRQIGDRLWERFSCERDQQAWYYSEKQDALVDLMAEENCHVVYWKMVNDYKDLFVSYFLDVENHCMVQKSENEGYCFDRNRGEWEVLPENVFVKGIEITRIFAETIEDAWKLKPESKKQWKEWLFSDVEDMTSEEITAMIIEELKRHHVIVENQKQEGAPCMG